MASTKSFPSHFIPPSYEQHRDLNVSSIASTSTLPPSFRSSSLTTHDSDGTDADLNRFASPSWPSHGPSAFASSHASRHQLGDGQDVLALLSHPFTAEEDDWERDLFLSRSDWKTAYETSVPGDRSPTSSMLLSRVDGMPPEERDVLQELLASGRYTDEVWGMASVPKSVRGVLETAKGKEREDKTVQRLRMVLNHLYINAQSAPPMQEQKASHWAAEMAEEVSARSAASVSNDNESSFVEGWNDFHHPLPSSSYNPAFSSHHTLHDPRQTLRPLAIQQPKGQQGASMDPSSSSSQLLSVGSINSIVDTVHRTTTDSTSRLSEPYAKPIPPRETDAGWMEEDEAVQERQLPPFRDFMHHQMNRIATGGRF